MTKREIDGGGAEQSLLGGAATEQRGGERGKERGWARARLSKGKKGSGAAVTDRKVKRKGRGKARE